MSTGLSRISLEINRWTLSERRDLVRLAPPRESGRTGHSPSDKTASSSLADKDDRSGLSIALTLGGFSFTPNDSRPNLPMKPFQLCMKSFSLFPSQECRKLPPWAISNFSFLGVFARELRGGCLLGGGGGEVPRFALPPV